MKCLANLRMRIKFTISFRTQHQKSKIPAILCLNRPNFLDAFLFHFLLSFEVYGRQHLVSSVFTLRILEYFDVVRGLTGECAAITEKGIRRALRLLWFCMPCAVSLKI